MQRLGGRLLLPEPGWRRFRLPNLPEELEARPASGRRQRRALLVALWLVASLITAELSGPEAGTGLFAGTALEPKTLWGALQGWVGSKHPSPPTDGTASRALSAPNQRAGAATAGTSAAPAAAPPPTPPRSVAGLAPIERQSPAVHQGAQFSQLGHLPSGFESSLEQDSAALAAETSSDRIPSTPQREALPSTSGADEELAVADDLARAVPRVWTQRAAQGCEQAHAAYQETLDMAAAPATPDVSREAFAARLENFDAYSRCDLNQPRDISICVAVQGGVAKGITVKTSPRDARLAACIVDAVGRMRFPSSPRMDLVRSELTVR